MIARRQLMAAVSIAAVGISLHTLAKDKRGRVAHAASSLPIEERLPSLAGATAWVNSAPLSAEALRGKVVLIDFWTYSCINWRRTMPYLRAWARKYEAQGLVVVGVHTPEFGFEKQLENVRWAIDNMAIGYPVALDNDYAVWNAFGNQYWPALYFVDARGNVRHRMFGEGDYAQAEATIQDLLSEAGARGVARDRVAVEGSGLEKAPDWSNLRSPENYLGYERTENFASPDGVVPDSPHTYAAPEPPALNGWGLAGQWTMQKEFAASNAPRARIKYRFHARDLHLVMGPKAHGASARFRVLLDGQPPGASHGGDVDASGLGTVVEQRLYQLIRQSQPIIDRVFEIEFLDRGVEAFSFTFS